jgi:hypothetical protein
MLKNKFLDKKKYITRFFYHLFMMDEIRAYRQHVVSFLKKISDPTTHFYPFKKKISGSNKQMSDT